MMLMMDNVYGTDIHNGAKEAANAKEAGHTGIENGVNVWTDNNLVCEHQIRNADQQCECDFAYQEEHYVQLHRHFLLGVLQNSKQLTIVLQKVNGTYETKSWMTAHSDL